MLSIRYLFVPMLALAACSAIPERACRAGQKALVNDALYFGTARPDGVVSAQDWADFLDSVVTPKFPDGFSVWQAAGQWKSESGAIVRESSYVLNLVHAENAATDAQIDSIMDAYKTRFHQEAVLRVHAGACVSF